VVVIAEALNIGLWRARRTAGQVMIRWIIRVVIFVMLFFLSDRGVRALVDSYIPWWTLGAGLFVAWGLTRKIKVPEPDEKS
jgi:hypothetical protein